MQTNISLQMNKIKKYKKRRYHLDNGVKIVLLVVSFPDLGNRNASDAPIISIDFIDNDNSRLFVFTEHVVQQIGSTFYQGLFLLWCHVAFTGDFNIYVGHNKDLLFSFSIAWKNEKQQEF